MQAAQPALRADRREAVLLGTPSATPPGGLSSFTLGRHRTCFSCSRSSWSQPRSAMVRSLVSIKSQGQVGAVQGVAVGIDLRGPVVNARSVRIARSIAGHWSRSSQGCRRQRLSCRHTPHSVWLRSPSGRVGVRRSLLRGGVSSVVHHSGHPFERRAPNTALVRTGRLRRPAAQLSR